MTSEDAKINIPTFRSPGAEWRALKAADPENKEEAASARKAADDLKNALLSSLQMQNLVVLAGSGCSFSAGGPSMGDLWNKAVGEEPSPGTVSTAAKVNHDLSDKNIESLLSRVEAYLQVNEDSDVGQFLDSSKQVILSECSSFLSTKKLEDHKTLLHRLSRRRARDQRLRIFTTNYDLCFERAAAELGGVALDGFSFTAPRRYDPRFFGYDIIRSDREAATTFGQYLEGVFSALQTPWLGELGSKGGRRNRFTNWTSRPPPRPA